MMKVVLGVGVALIVVGVVLIPLPGPAGHGHLPRFDAAPEPLEAVWGHDLKRIPSSVLKVDTHRVGAGFKPDVANVGHCIHLVTPTAGAFV